MAVGGQRNRCRLSNISYVYCRDAHRTERHRVDVRLRQWIFQRCVILEEVIRTNDSEWDIKLSQGAFDSQLRGEMRDVLEVLYAKDRVINDVLQFQLPG